jgi:flagellin-like protein
MTFMRERKAISPVIATVILVAVAITVAVGVSYWMGGISSQYTSFEKVEIQSGICRKLGGTGVEYWNVTMKLKNSGTADATLIGVFINEIEVDAYSSAAAVDQWAVTNMPATYTIQTGVTGKISVLIDCDYSTLTSGTTVNIKVHSAGGMDYIKLIQLV